MSDELDQLLGIAPAGKVDDLDAALGLGAQTSAPAAIRPPNSGQVAARARESKKRLQAAPKKRSILGEVYDVAKDAGEQYTRDVGGAIVSLGEGMITAIPELAEGVPGVVGEASKDFTTKMHRNAEETHRTCRRTGS